MALNVYPVTCCWLETLQNIATPRRSTLAVLATAKHSGPSDTPLRRSDTFDRDPPPPSSPPPLRPPPENVVTGNRKWLPPRGGSIKSKGIHGRLFSSERPQRQLATTCTVDTVWLPPLRGVGAVAVRVLLLFHRICGRKVQGKVRVWGGGSLKSTSANQEFLRSALFFPPPTSPFLAVTEL